MLRAGFVSLLWEDSVSYVDNDGRQEHIMKFKNTIKANTERFVAFCRSI